MTDNQVIVKVREVYGVERIYPVSNSAELFAQIAGKKTFDSADIRRIKQLGFEVQAEAPTL